MKPSSKNKIINKSHSHAHLAKGGSSSKEIVKKSRATHSSFLHAVKRNSKTSLKRLLLSSYFQKVVTGLVAILVLSACFYGVYRYFNVSLANDVVVSQSEIIDRVAKLTSLPQEKPEAVVRVEDAETLKKQNVFYENVKVGDYIVVFSKVAVIYDLRNNSIVAIKKSEE